MTGHAKLDARLIVLERQMPEVRKLASAASIEVGDIRAKYRAYHRVLEALRETQLEQGVRFEARFESLEAKVDRGFALLHVGMELMAERLASREGDSSDS